MKIPMTPPSISELMTMGEGDAESRLERFMQILNTKFGPTPNGIYRHWDILRHLEPPNGFSTAEWWLGVKLSRQHLYKDLPFNDKKGNHFKYAPTDIANQMLHQIDRNASGAIKGAHIDQITSPETRETYLLKSLAEEAITSSQLEGASTTREVAKEMIKTGRPPRDRSEQMIYNNYQAMQFIRSLGKNEPMTKDIVFELHRILTDKTLEKPESAGRFRKHDEGIVVEDQNGLLLHSPPPSKELEGRMQSLCVFANNWDSDPFLHPVIRAVLLHFLLAYDHPFVDGNGRTARALFYWSMAQHEYWLCEFLSISKILREGPSRYARAFLYTETDDSDTTYFVLNQLRVILRAIDELHSYLKFRLEKLKETRDILAASPVAQALLNARQLSLLRHALDHPGFLYTILSHKRSHSISYQTARTDLLDLAEIGLLQKGKRGNQFIFSSPENLRTQLNHRSRSERAEEAS